MDEDEFAGLIRQREAESANDPVAFKRRVVFVSVAAYLALAVFLALVALATYYGFGWARASQSLRSQILFGLFVLSMVPLFWVVGRFFLMRLDPPVGRALHRDEAPKLFETLDKLRRRLKGPPIHHVLIDADYNAAIVQRPRFGLFGGHTNYLIIGLPFLIGTAPKEALAILAHEYGHLCGDHGKIGAWIYRQRNTFMALYQQVHDRRDEGVVEAVVARVIERFWPHYAAYTFVLARQQEYDADRTATNLVGAASMASALTRAVLMGEWVDRSYWRSVYARAAFVAIPPVWPFAGLTDAIAAGQGEWASAEQLTRCWREESGVSDTHPCLRERVEAIGEKPRLPAPLNLSAADFLLGTFAPRLIETFDTEWWGREKADWEARHRRVQNEKSALSTLNARRIETLSLSELQQFALLKWDHETPVTAKPVLEYLLAKPGGPFPKAAYLFGRILLSERNNRGLDHLESAALHDSSLVDDAIQAGYDYLASATSEAAAEAWWQRVVSRLNDA